MEEVKKQNNRNILPLIFIGMAMLLLVSHLTIQMIETHKSENEITKKDLQLPKDPVESLKPDSIWNGTEFMPE
ncbi:MAG: hypothetical protein R6V23_15580 [Bacteroidales bacterium]